MRKLRVLRFGVLGGLTLVVLAGCSRGYFFQQRDTWRREAELTCLKSGSVKESPTHVRIEPIEGPGMCGADFPLKVSALGESRLIGYSDDVRPPGAIPGAAQPNWPIADPRYSQPADPRPPAYPRPYSPAAAGTPMPISPPGLAPQRAGVGTYDRAYPAPPAQPLPASSTPRRPSVFDRPPPLTSRNADDDDEDEPAMREPQGQPGQPYRPSQPAPYGRAQSVPLGNRPLTTASVGPVEIKPTATLACPIVSALDRWIMDAVQPSALRWFGQPVVEIKQISAYSCRGMNGQAGARISEHAFGNALDVAAFILADGHKVTVKDGWRGTPEEQAFLHDVQGAACEQFTTVLAPGSNAFHYDHIHVDLMRRASGRVICQPGAIPGDVVAARAREKAGMYARRGDPGITGSIAKTASATKKTAKKKKGSWPPLEEEDESILEELDEPRGGPGED